MHRSGTSALARVLEMTGAYPGEVSELLPAHPQDNPRGYWERADIVLEHHRFLEDAGYGWDRVAWFELNRVDQEARTRLAQSLQPIFQKLRAQGHSWLIKDPRLCLLLPIWTQILTNAIFVVAVRDPREVAASMQDGPRGVYTSHFLLALWEKYLRSALAALKSKQVVFVSYARLLTNPSDETERLCKALHALGATDLSSVSEAELRDFLDPQLRRSAPQLHVQLSSQQNALFEWLEKQCRAPGAVRVNTYPDGEPPDTTLAEFQQAMDDAARGHNPALGIAASQAKLAEDLNQSHIQRQEALSKADDLIERLAEREQALHSLQAEREQLEQSVEQRLHESEQLHERVAGLLAAHEEHWQLLSTLADELKQQRQQSESLRADNDELRKRNEALTQAFEDERERWSVQQQGFARDLEAQRSGYENLQAQLDESRVRIEELTRHLDLGREQSAAMARHASALEQGMAALRNSWSWRLSAPLRIAGTLRAPRLSWSFEQSLYRFYYSLPGPSAARKRAFVLWLHEHAAWLTQRTFSYRLNQQAKEMEHQRIADQEVRDGLQRMDDNRAATVIAQLAHKPTISIVLPVYNVEARWLLAAVESVRRQFYPHWELCIADDASTRAETRQAFESIKLLRDKRIKLYRLAENGGIARASNTALKMATGEFVGLLDHDDELTRDALLEIVRVINDKNPDFVYSDEDKLDENGNHVEVHCKPDFSPDYFFSLNYLCHFSVLRRSLLMQIKGFRPGFDGAQDYDLFLRATEHTQRIVHVPKVLYHWRKIAGSTASTSQAKPTATNAGQRALAESMQRRSIACEVEPGPFPNSFRVRRKILDEPLVSILIPFHDKAPLLDACVSSILKKTRYPHFEILCIDNRSVEPETAALMERLRRADSRVRFERFDAPFNYSAINNYAVRFARGEHLLFLNNDTEVIAPEWLDSMLEHSQRPEVGVVGARLLYGDGTIQHAGVIVGPGGVAGHAHLFVPGDDPGYFSRIRLVQNLSAVTFACAMTRRAVFEEIGGLNADDLKIAFNDVDYCLRARDAGYLVVYTPFALLRHYESKSRGYEDTPEKQARFSSEVIYMRQRHKAHIEGGDPYYNPRLSLSNSFQPDPNYVYELPR